MEIFPWEYKAILVERGQDFMARIQLATLKGRLALLRRALQPSMACE
jgi:hypothetical protein